MFERDLELELALTRFLLASSSRPSPLQRKTVRQQFFTWRVRREEIFHAVFVKSIDWRTTNTVRACCRLQLLITQVPIQVQ